MLRKSIFPHEILTSSQSLEYRYTSAIEVPVTSVKMIAPRALPSP